MVVHCIYVVLMISFISFVENRAELLNNPGGSKPVMQCVCLTKLKKEERGKVRR